MTTALWSLDYIKLGVCYQKKKKKLGVGYTYQNLASLKLSSKSEKKNTKIGEFYGILFHSLWKLYSSEYFNIEQIQPI